MASQQQSVEQIFGVALDLNPEQRRAFLDDACREAPELRELVEELLREDLRAGSFLRRPIFDSRHDGFDRDRSFGESDVTRSSGLPPPGRFRAGQTIANRFEVVRFIARGGMGEVYEVEDRYLQGAHVALKMILPAIAADAFASHRLEQEVILARKVTHPNLCPIYDIFHCDDPAPPFLFLTMKLLAGETLARRLARPARIPADEALGVIGQAISGVSALHAAGVIHRDIKPNNVMLDRSGDRLHLSIMDFGLARLHEAEATLLNSGVIAGTPGYLAPELLLGQAPSEATDIYALGVMLHLVMTGERPVSSPEGLSTQPSSALSSAGVPACFIKAVREFLAADPQRRCRAFNEIHASLESGAISPRGFLESPRRWTRRSFAIASGASLIAVGSGVAWQHDRIYDMFHPLPPKRFVAILGWPPTSDVHFKPMLLGLIDSMANELSRAEAFDRDLFVISQRTPTEMTTRAQVNDVRESLGANLILATSGVPAANAVYVALQVLEPTSLRPLRMKRIRMPVGEQVSLPGKVIQAAAELLDIDHYQPDERRSGLGTRNPEALAAYQAAQAFKKQANDKGLDTAIEQYKTAIELDPRFALAAAQLTIAYLRAYIIRREPAALELARANSQMAMSLDDNLVEAHVANASVMNWTGDKPGALKEMTKALALDPANARTLLYRAQLLTHCNRWREAEEAFSRLLIARPNYWLVHEEFGVYCSARGDYRKALLEYRAASLIASKSAVPLNGISESCLALGRPDEAIEFARKSLSTVPNFEGAAAMASALRCLGKSTEAVPYAQKAVDLDPENAANWLRLGDCLAPTRERRTEARSAYVQAAKVAEHTLQANSDDGPGWMLFALAQAKTGEMEDSARSLQTAEKLFIDDMDSKLLRVRILELLGRRVEAISTLAECLARGGTAFQVETMPDLEALRKDSRYLKLVG